MGHVCSRLFTVLATITRVRPEKISPKSLFSKTLTIKSFVSDILRGIPCISNKTGILQGRGRGYPPAQTRPFFHAK